jgi:uncharacterized protein
MNGFFCHLPDPVPCILCRLQRVLTWPHVLRHELCPGEIHGVRFLQKQIYPGNIDNLILPGYKYASTDQGEEKDMNEKDTRHCTAFAGSRCIASGELSQVAGKVKEALQAGEKDTVLIFDDLTSRPVEVDFRGSMGDVLERVKQAPDEAGAACSDNGSPRGPGRPKLGVVAREVTLLPRHWEWLAGQPGGASVALRKLVEKARRENSEADRVRLAQESANRFMTAMAGDLPGFEEATRALFSGDRKRFEKLIAAWPGDIRSHARKVSDAAFRE